MAFKRPTLTEINERAQADAASRIPGADASLRRSVLAALVRTHAGTTHGLYGFLDFAARQALPSSAQEEFLDAWAGIWVGARKPAIEAAGTVTFTGDDGATVPAGSAVLRNDGAEYVTAEDATIVDGTGDATVTATAAGVAGDTAAGVKLALTATIAGIVGEATVSGEGITGGSDLEADDTYRARMVARIQQPPHGGADFDYEAWTLDQEAHGVAVTRAWVSRHELGVGTVTIRFMMDDSRENGIPLASDVEIVADYIDTVRPASAKAVTVVAPIASPVDYVIAGLNPATEAVRSAIEAELRDLHYREAAPGQTLLHTHISEAISIAAGETDHVLVKPDDDVRMLTGRVPTFGSLSWS